jgi:hypothetical protein
MLRAFRRTPDAIRSRRYRQRRHDGRAVFQIEADHDALVLALIAAGYISERDALDPRRVQLALGEMVGTFVKRWCE